MRSRRTESVLGMIVTTFPRAGHHHIIHSAGITSPRHRSHQLAIMPAAPAAQWGLDRVPYGSAPPRRPRPPTDGADGTAAPAASSWPGVPP